MMATLGIFVVATVLLTKRRLKERHFGIPRVPFLLSE